VTLDVIIPACNEAGYIDACLSALIRSRGVSGRVIVAANGCTDDTASRARAWQQRAGAAGWDLIVLDLPALGKHGALNAADGQARDGGVRVYLDADVIVSPELLSQIVTTLAKPGVLYASGQPVVAPARSGITRAYARFWQRLPFVTTNVPGFGVFAVNAAGRARWAEFPRIISDDTFVRLSFEPHERLRVPATYDWPMVEGFSRLVRVRRRQDQGVAEIARLFPDMPARDGTPRPGKGWLIAQLLRDPVAFGVYAAVTLAVRAGWGRQSGWVRGR
jgi:glycosyltransferase involved in cell wall biosynthesis